MLDDPSLAAEMVDHNYELGRRFYSFRTLERRLALLVQDTLGTDPEDDLFAHGEQPSASAVSHQPHADGDG